MIHLLRIAPALLTALALPACRTIERHPGRPVSSALAPVPGGRVAETARTATASLPAGHSAFVLLEEAREALDWRLALIDHATRSIDLQYYLWNRDAAGLLLLSRLLDAADRGVRVRLLLDDLLVIDEFLFEGEEARLAALCHHENIEIRIFNPQFVRSAGPAAALETLLRIRTLNRRMHNKAVLVDNRIAVIGGRNIGNEYFGLNPEFNFLDLDVLAAGPVVVSASESFDRYWNSPLSFPGEAFAPSTGPEALPAAAGEIRRRVREERELLPPSPYPKHRRDWSRDFASLGGTWHSGPAVLVDDRPARAEESLSGGRAIERALAEIGSKSRQELILATPYVLPEGEIHQLFRGLVDRGVGVRLLTASLEANNHLPIHGHYRRHRRLLLTEGVEVHEMRADANAGMRAFAEVAPMQGDRLLFHVKAGVSDRSRCFIGSLNLDPRTIDLNTENGILIESPGLAAELAAHLDTIMAPDNAWEVTFDPHHRLRWTSRGEMLTRQPAPDRRSRVLDVFWGWLPIEPLL